MRRRMAFVLAVVLAAVMLFSVPVFAATMVERLYILPGEEVAGKTIALHTEGCISTTVTNNGNGSFTQTLKQETQGGVGAYITITDPAIIDQYPYLVLEVLSAGMIEFSFYGWDEDMVESRPFSSGYMSATGKSVANLKTGQGISGDFVKGNETYTCQIWLRGHQFADWTAKLYLTNSADEAEGTVSSAVSNRVYLKPSQDVQSNVVKLEMTETVNTVCAQKGDNSFTQTLNQDMSQGTVGSWFYVGDTELLQKYPYLVLEVLENNGIMWSFYGWDEDLVGIRPFTTGWTAQTGKFIADFKTNRGVYGDRVAPDQTYTCQIFLKGTAGASWTVKAYLTDDPVAPQAGGTSTVRAQLQSGVTEQSESANLRFVAVLDSLNMYEVGFVVSLSNSLPVVGGENVTQIRTTTVWDSVQAGGNTVTAQSLGGKYVYGLTITDVDNANFDTKIYVRSYARVADGSYQYTDVKAYTVAELLG